MTIRRTGLVYIAITVILAVSLLMLTGCGSKKLVDQSDKDLGTLIESIQANYAEDGWTYSGYEVVGADEENDTEVVAIAYDVEGDVSTQLKENSKEKANNDYIFGLAEGVQVKANVELSNFDKDNNSVDGNLQSTTWFVGESDVDTWIKEQNQKWKKVGDTVSFTTDNGTLEVTIDGASKTDWDDSSDSAYMASIRATIKNVEYTNALYDEGVCQYDIIDKKDIIVTTEDGVSCAGGDLLGPTDGAYDPDAKIAQGEKGRMCLEVFVPTEEKNVILKFGDEAFMYLPIDQNVVSY